MLIADQIILKREQRIITSPLSFRANPGQCLELVGPNGSGKTSLLKLLSRQAQPFQGAIHYFLKDAKPLYGSLQSGFDLNRSLEDNLLYLSALENQKHPLISEALTYFELTAFKNKLFGTLSAGQKQCTHLMRLILWPRYCWLLDEPMTSLDSRGEDLVRRLCQKHQSRGGLIIIASPKPLGLGEIISLKKENNFWIQTVEEEGKTSWI